LKQYTGIRRPQNRHTYSRQSALRSQVKGISISGTAFSYIEIIHKYQWFLSRIKGPGAVEPDLSGGGCNRVFELRALALMGSLSTPNLKST
jgi:hypothetical protein